MISLEIGQKNSFGGCVVYSSPTETMLHCSKIEVPAMLGFVYETFHAVLISTQSRNYNIENKFICFESIAIPEILDRFAAGSDIFTTAIPL
jgi:hypothetical protein